VLCSNISLIVVTVVAPSSSNPHFGQICAFPKVPAAGIVVDYIDSPSGFLATCKTDHLFDAQVYSFAKAPSFFNCGDAIANGFRIALALVIPSSFLFRDHCSEPVSSFGMGQWILNKPVHDAVRLLGTVVAAVQFLRSDSVVHSAFSSSS